MSRQTNLNRVMLGAAIAIALAAAAVGYTRIQQRSDAIDDAKASIGNYASIMAQHVSSVSSSIALTLDELVDHHIDVTSRERFAAKTVTREFYEHIRNKLGRLPQIEVITVTNSDGDILATTRLFPRPLVNLSDRDDFIHLRDTRDNRITVSKPFRSITSSAWTVYFARRIETVSGEFLGVIHIGVLPELFIKTKGSLTNLDGQSFAALRRDGVILMRTGDTLDRTGMIIPQEFEWYRAVESGGSQYRSPGYFDGVPRYVAVRPLSESPLVVTVAFSEDVALATWRRRTYVVAILTVLVLGTVGLLFHAMFVLHRSMLRNRNRLRERDAKVAEQSQEIATTNGRFELALENMAQGVALFNEDGRLVLANKRYAEMYGLRSEQLPPGIDIQDVFALRIANGLFANGSPDAYKKVLESGDNQRRIDRLPDGRSIFVKRQYMRDGRGWVTTHDDVTEQVEASARLEHLAMHDVLTDLPNRMQFVKKLSDATEGQVISRETVAVLLIDLDGFKYVNDTYGHSVGDELLRQVATRLVQASPLDFVARLGGDEFIILRMCGPQAHDEANELAEQMMAEIQIPFEIGLRKLSISISIGIEILEPDERDVERIMRGVDLALYRAKHDGRNCCRTFAPEMEAKYLARADLTADLRAAIDAGDIQAHYQPIVAATTCRVVAMEALLRWAHPVRGMISPATFIPLAEETGLIAELGEWVLQRACADAAKWPEAIMVSVNVSPLQIAQRDFVDTVKRALAASGLSSHRLEIEITESVLLHDDVRNLSVLHSLRALGVSIALDDFGTGFSSLSYLKQFPFDKLKIDKSFVDEVTTHRGCAAIIAATTMLARSFDIITTAEGVETNEQFETLRAASVTLMQGYFFGRPKPNSEWRVEDGRIILPGITGVDRCEAGAGRGFH